MQIISNFEVKVKDHCTKRWKNRSICKLL